MLYFPVYHIDRIETCCFLTVHVEFVKGSWASEIFLYVFCYNKMTVFLYFIDDMLIEKYHLQI